MCYTIDPGVCQVIKWGVGPEAPTGPACPPTQVRGDCHTTRELEEGVRIEGGEIEQGRGGGLMKTELGRHWEKAKPRTVAGTYLST